jgi:hypothetical protein
MDFNSNTLLFKSPESLGITQAKDYSSLDANLQILNQYNKAILNGDTYILNDDNDSVATQPFGNRKFLKTNVSCMRYDNNKDTERYILVDNMKFMKDKNGNLDTRHYGLLYSAEGSLQDVDANSIFSDANMNFDKNATGNKCVPVSIYLDNSNTTRDTKYVTINDCNRIDSVAFVNGIKDCKVNESFTNKDSSVYDEENTYNRTRFQSRLVIEDDFWARYYITGITCIGLFIFYKLYNKK